MPAHAADARNHEAAFDGFLTDNGDWERYNTWEDGTSVATHESLTLRILFEHGAGPRDAQWTIAAYESLVSERMWHMAITPTTPQPILHTLLTALSDAQAWETALGTAVTDKTVAQATRPLTEAGWTPTVEGSRLHWQPQTGDAGIQFDALAANAPHQPLDTWTIWPAPASTSAPGPSAPPSTLRCAPPPRHHARNARPADRTDLSAPAPVPRSTRSRSSAAREDACHPPTYGGVDRIIISLRSSAAREGNHHGASATQLPGVHVAALLGRPGGRPLPSCHRACPGRGPCCDPRSPWRATATGKARSPPRRTLTLRSSVARKGDRRRLLVTVLDWEHAVAILGHPGDDRTPGTAGIRCDPQSPGGQPPR
ncbi:DUF317 domain-containing protein [Streptomyces sp. SID13726]|nr:DUF317 domain-containing protein [Streptomyces sp. SID13726]